MGTQSEVKVWGAAEKRGLTISLNPSNHRENPYPTPEPNGPKFNISPTRPPPEPHQNAQPRPADPQIISIVSIVSIVSIARRGREKRHSTITPVRANHRRIACPTFPENCVHVDPLSKTPKKRPQTGPTHFNHFNRLLFSQNGDVCTPRFPDGLP